MVDMRPVLLLGHYRPWFYNKSEATMETLTQCLGGDLLPAVSSIWESRKPNLFGPNLELRPAGAQFGGHVVNYVSWIESR